MKPKLTEQSECKFVAEFDPTPSNTINMLGVGFNSDLQVMSPFRLHNLCRHLRRF